MEKILNYQASFFGNFSEIRSDFETIQKFTNAYESFSFIPVPVTNIDMRTNKLIRDNRIRLFSSDKTFLITFLPERIDFTFSFNSPTSSTKDFTPLSTTIKEKIDILNKLLPEQKGNRLSTSCLVSLKNYSNPNELNSIIHRFSSKSIFYEDSENINEWQVRYNSQQLIEVNNKKENSNHIINLSLSQFPELQNSILFMVDINTDPRNEEFRFNYNELKEYLDLATSKINKYIEKANNE